MAYKLPGNSGVTVYQSPEEAKAAGVIDKVEQGSDGNLYATPHQGWLLNNMPWLILGGMGAGAGMAAMGGGAAAAAGAGSGAAASGGTAAATGAAVAAGGAPVAASAGFWSSPLALGLIGQGVGLGTNLIGAHMQSTAAGKAAALQQAGNQQSLDFLSKQDARDFAEYVKERDRLWGQEDVDRTRTEEDRQLKLLREKEREARMAPFRAGAADSYTALKGLLQVPQGGVMHNTPISSAISYAPQLADLLRR